MYRQNWYRSIKKTNPLTHIHHQKFKNYFDLTQKKHGRTDSYRVATVTTVPDDNLTADGFYKVYPFSNFDLLLLLFFSIWILHTWFTYLFTPINITNIYNGLDGFTTNKTNRFWIASGLFFSPCLSAIILFFCVWALRLGILASKHNNRKSSIWIHLR